MTSTKKSDNPLLSIEFEVPFDAIEPKHVEPAITELLDRAKKAVDGIAHLEGDRSYANILGALEDATEPLEIAMTVVSHLESVSSNPELREAYNKTRPEVSAFYASIPLNAELWKTLEAFEQTAEFESLEGAKRRFATKTMDDFRRHGADLDAAGKARLEAISRELAEVTNKFSQNLLDSTAAWDLVIEDEARLAGLPDSAKAQAKQSAESKDKTGFRFTLQAPSVIPVLTYLDDAKIREQVYRAYNRRAADGDKDNRPLIAKILELRNEEAKLLGYADFSDFVLEDRMAKKGEAAQAFIRDLESKSRSAFEREQTELLTFRRSIEGPDAPELNPWDVGYYSEKQRRALYDFDDEELRPYFSAPRVVDGLFETAQRLYGVSFKEDKDMPRWHKDVRCFRIMDGSEVLGAFYVDLFPREEKRGGAWMNALVTGGPVDGVGGGRFHPHLGLICANVTPPVGDEPALLTHDEVSTLFHEFGHLLHHLLSRVEVRSLGGTNVAWDFVELPSQIMENWCWEREALDLFARHYKTDATIPNELFEKMTKARTYREASAMMRQLGFASVDLALHRQYDSAKDGDIVAYANAILARYSPVGVPEGYSFITSFGHLFSSAVAYAAGYYSYKWAEVLDADAFTRFKKEGVYNAHVGNEFRRKILERGDSEDPMELYKAFMGREPSVDALLERSGLAG